MATSNTTIRVSVRVRPCDQSKKNSIYCIEQGGNTYVKWISNQNGNQTKQFSFDNVYWDSNNTQESIFQDIGQVYYDIWRVLYLIFLEILIITTSFENITANCI